MNPSFLGVITVITHILGLENPLIFPWVFWGSNGFLIFRSRQLDMVWMCGGFHTVDPSVSSRLVKNVAFLFGWEKNRKLIQSKGL